MVQPIFPSNAHARRRRAATLVEYALILVGILLIGAGAMKLLGSRMSTRLDGAGGSVAGGSGGGNGGGSGGGSGGSGGGSAGGGGGGSAGGGGGGGGGVAGKSNAASKASLGGGTSSDDLNGGGGQGSGESGGSGGRGGGSGSSADDDHGVAATLADGDMDSPRMKRLMAICFLIAGSAALGYYAFKAKKAVSKKPD